MRAIGAEWLRYKQRCYIITWERSPWPHARHKPDLVGVTESRHVIEIEIKRTMGDFKQDEEKVIWHQRRMCTFPSPAKFYYMVPPELVEKVRPLLKEGHGLLAWSGESKWSKLPLLEVQKGATTNRLSKPLTLRQMVDMVRHQSGAVTRALAAVARVCPVEEIPPLPAAEDNPIISDHAI